MKNVRTPLAIIVLMLVVVLTTYTSVSAQSGKIYGTVRDTDGDPAAGANVQLMHEGTLVTGKHALSDINGKYEINNVETGSYTIQVSYSGKTTEDKEVIRVSGNYKPVDLLAGSVILDGGDPITPRPKIIFDVDPMDVVGMTGKDMRDAGIRKPSDVIGLQAGVYQKEPGGAINVGGQRSGGTITFVDGAKMIGVDGLPQAAIEEVTMMSGGMPAEYGDASGGVIIVTTRNPGMKSYAGQAASLFNIGKHKERKPKQNPDASLPVIFPDKG